MLWVTVYGPLKQAGTFTKTKHQVKRLAQLKKEKKRKKCKHY
jgi:hypothetical protein